MKSMQYVSFACAAVLTLTASALAQPAPRSFYVRGSVGIASQSLKDWNDDLKDDEQVFRSAGVPVDFDGFGVAYPLGVEVGFQMTETASVGAGLHFQKGSMDNAYSDFTGSLSASDEVSITAVTGNISMWLPGTRGLFVGVNAGHGWGKAESEFHFRDYGDPTNDLDVSAEWDGTGAVFGVFAGYQHSFPGGPLLFTKLGYQFQNLGELDGTAWSPQLGAGAGPPRNNAGAAMDTDFSGVQLALGFGFAVGTP